MTAAAALAFSAATTADVRCYPIEDHGGADADSRFLSCGVCSTSYFLPAVQPSVTYFLPCIDMPNPPPNLITTKPSDQPTLGSMCSTFD